MGFLIWTAAFLSSACAHMSLTANSIYPREKAVVFDDYRSPDLTVTCHGTNPGPAQFTVDAGDTIQGTCTYGAAHGGGHCAWMITTDQKTYYKLNDKVDCTLDCSHNLVIPASVPIECGQRCTLSWFWTPRLSGGCEIYHNCFDITVNGAVGGIEQVVQPYVPGASPECLRVDENGVTPIYGPFIGSDGVPTPVPGVTLQPPGGGDGGADENGLGFNDLYNGCVNYTIVAGDTLDKIARGFDIQWPLVQKANIVNYPSLETNPDFIDVGWVLQIPQTYCAVEEESCSVTACHTYTPGYPESENTAFRPQVKVLIGMGFLFLQLWALL